MTGGLPVSWSGIYFVASESESDCLDVGGERRKGLPSAIVTVLSFGFGNTNEPATLIIEERPAMFENPGGTEVGRGDASSPLWGLLGGVRFADDDRSTSPV